MAIGIRLLGSDPPTTPRRRISAFRVAFATAGTTKPCWCPIRMTPWHTPKGCFCPRNCGRRGAPPPFGRTLDAEVFVVVFYYSCCIGFFFVEAIGGNGVRE